MSTHENCPCMAECPLNRALRLIGGKWKMQILCSLHNNGPTRYNQLKRTLDGVSNTVPAGAQYQVAGLVRELEGDGLVIRREFLEVPVRVEYDITERSWSLIPILDQLGRWCDSMPAGGDMKKSGADPADDGGAAL